MKKYIGFLLLCVFIACDNELDLVEEKTEIPIVYGLISPSANVQYIRLERAFVDPEVSALVIAQNPDSLYYDSAVVQIRNEESGHTYTATRVDGNLEGFPREEGVFAQSPNYLYKIVTDQIPIEEKVPYSLQISIGEIGENITASTIGVENPVLPQFAKGTNVNFRYQIPQKFDWTPKVNSIIYDLTMIIHYSELLSDGTINDVNLRWPLATNTEVSEYQFLGEEFYIFIGNNADNSDSDALRFFNGLSLELVSGGQNVADYVNVGKANLGITSSGEIPTFTNLSTGLGLFGSKNTLLKSSVTLQPEALDSLRNGIHTRHLNFQ